MQLVAEIIPREAYTADAYSGALYPTSSRAHLALIAEAENVREVKLHLEAWDVASESYFAVWEALFQTKRACAADPFIWSG